MYYLGKGTELKKEECKEYKTIEGALKAAAKDEELVVWDENGEIIGSLTDNVPEGAEQQVSGEDEEQRGQQVSDSDTIYPEKQTKVIVDCDGALNLRRSASWENGNICGRAVRGQSYYIKAIHTVEGKKMIETIDGIFLSGQPEFVRFE